MNNIDRDIHSLEQRKKLSNVSRSGTVLIKAKQYYRKNPIANPKECPFTKGYGDLIGWLDKSETACLCQSEIKDKKYVLWNGKNTVHFGNINYEDFTKSENENLRDLYLKRSAGIRGNWRDNPYSANNLSRNLLW